MRWVKSAWPEAMLPIDFSTLPSGLSSRRNNSRVDRLRITTVSTAIVVFVRRKDKLAMHLCRAGDMEYWLPRGIQDRIIYIRGSVVLHDFLEKTLVRDVLNPADIGIAEPVQTKAVKQRRQMAPAPA